MKKLFLDLSAASFLAISLLVFPILRDSPGEVSAERQAVLGIEELCRLDLLPRIKSSVRIGCVSSYDRTGGNDDGFSGAHSFVRKEAGGLVIAELEGPGIIYRVHTPTPTEDFIEFYFDGETSPRIIIKLSGLFDGSKSPFLLPLVGYGAGGYYSYVPIAFQRSCKILVKTETFHFYQINYALYPENTEISSYQEPPPAEFLRRLEEVGEILNSAGSDISYRLVPEGTRIETQAKRGVLKPQEKLKVFETSGPGRIVGLKLSPAGAFANKSRDILLKMYWDDRPEPAVNCPVGDFFGYSFGEPASQSLFLGTSDGTNYIYLPMPFERSARIELVSEQASGPGLEVQTDVKFTRRGKAGNEGRFYALWRRENPTRMGMPYTFLKTTGQGHIVGVALQAQGLEPGQTAFFEGDDRVVIDGELAIPGTGTEDSFNGGYYDIPGRWDERASFPLSGCLDYKKPLGRTGGYRWMITDAYPYTKSIEFTVEHGPVGNLAPTDYTSVTCFYSLDPPALDLTLLPPAARRISDPESIVFTPGWNVPIHTFARRATLAKKTAEIGKNKSIYYLSLRATDKITFGSHHTHHISFIFEIPSAGRYEVRLKALLGPDQGIVRMFRQGRPEGEPVNLYEAERNISPSISLGVLDVVEGDNIVSMNVVGRDPRSDGVGLDLVEIAFERIK